MTVATNVSVCRQLGLPEPALKLPTGLPSGHKLPIAWPEYHIALLLGPEGAQDWIASEALLADWKLVKSTDESLASGGAIKDVLRAFRAKGYELSPDALRALAGRERAIAS